MSTGEFIVRVADLDAGTQQLERAIERSWLARALADTEAEPWERPGEAGAVGSVALEVTKNGRRILVQGTVQARVTLPCARTLDAAHYELTSQVFLLLSPASEQGQPPSPASRESRTRRAKGARGGESFPKVRKAPATPKKGKRKGGGWAEDPELSEEDAATDTYSGEEVLLDDFIREFIVLEFPMFPLREDLRSDAVEASSPLPSGTEATQLEGDRPVDPRLSPLAELKARLENKE